MKSNYKRIGDYIREVKVRNKDLSVNSLMGINIDKYFMPSVAKDRKSTRLNSSH